MSAFSLEESEVATAHIGLNQAVDHESGRHVDAVLAGIFAVLLYLTIEVGDRNGLGKLHVTVVPYAPDDVVGRGIKIRAMVVEFKFFTMRGYSRHRPQWGSCHYHG
jgi:hypothetical protein